MLFSLCSCITDLPKPMLYHLPTENTSQHIYVTLMWILLVYFESFLHHTYYVPIIFFLVIQLQWLKRYLSKSFFWILLFCLQWLILLHKYQVNVPLCIKHAAKQCICLQVHAAFDLLCFPSLLWCFYSFHKTSFYVEVFLKGINDLYRVFDDQMCFLLFLDENE